MEFLGYNWDAEHKVIKITEEERAKYRRAVRNLIRSPQPAARWRATIGKLLFLKDAIGPAMRHVRSLLKAMKGRKGTTMIVPSGEALEDLKWWHATLGCIREASLINAPVSASITTDASDNSLGHIVETGDKKMERTLLTTAPNSHINAKELEALLKALEAHGE